MTKLLVKRKAHPRGSYVRKDGTRVSASRVDASTFKIKDMGKPGRTPKSKRWFEPGEPLGWRADDPMSKRRRIALKNRGGDYLAAGRALLALANVQRKINPDVSRKARSDADYFFRMHRKTGK